MMIGVAQVIGMKPTLRSFFSGECFSRGLDREELRDGGQSGRGADRFQERAACGIPGKHRTHHGGGHDALVTLLLGMLLFKWHRLAAQRASGPIMLTLGTMLAAGTARPRQHAVRIKRIVKGGHAAFPSRGAEMTGRQNPPRPGISPPGRLEAAGQ
jgi:hypothetical protein